MAVSSRHRLMPNARTVRDECQALERWIADLIEAGIDAVQLREPDLGAGRLRDLVAWSRRCSSGTRTCVLVNDRVDVALAGDAHGVHLPAAGLDTRRVREFEPAWLVGRSAHGASDSSALAANDYLVFGTVFASRSKPNGTVKGLEGLRSFVALSGRPVLAIGGVTAERAGACLRAGARGVAAIEPFLPEGREAASVGPLRAVRELREAMAVDQSPPINDDGGGP